MMTTPFTGVLRECSSTLDTSLECRTKLILVCGTGIGMSMTANHIPGIRAALCGCEFQARATRQHNNANVLCLGERVTGQGVALDIAELFLNTAFEGGRHLRRINQIEG